jgi:hypothetical protein
MQLGDARAGKLPENLAAFGRSLRRAGLPVDTARIALATQSTLLLGLQRKDDLEAALEAVFVSREQDRMVFRELFQAFFRDPEMAHKLLAQMLPRTPGSAEPSRKRARVREALSPQRQGPSAGMPRPQDDKVDFDAAMTASDQHRLRHADFQTLTASEYKLVERLAREIPLPLPQFASRRTRLGTRGATPHWSAAMRRSLATGGELFGWPLRERRMQSVPLLLLVDVSGSMERYARLLLSFLHAATRHARRRDVFAFGTHLTDLGAAFRLADTDAMLEQTSRLIDDFAGGTRMGESLALLRRQHARKLVGRRTLVLVISDGLDTGDTQELRDQLEWLRLHCARIVWLNPLLRFAGYAPLAQGASALHQVADAMLAVHNLSRLEDLATGIAQLLQTPRAARRQ